MSEVRPVSLNQALTTSLNNYYDLLKNQVGGLAAEEFLQLKLVADPVDVNDQRYRFWSQYNLLVRSDLRIENVPVSGTVLTGAETLARSYGRFLQKLRQKVTITELTPEQNAQIADIDQELERLRDQIDDLLDSEAARWARYCARTGTSPTNYTIYAQWRGQEGYTRQIQDKYDRRNVLLFRKKSITDRQYRHPEDREIIDAEFSYELPEMRLRYPMRPDYEYSDAANFSVDYLARLPLGSTALFDDRRALSWNVSMPIIQSTQAGNFSAVYSTSTTSSTSIERDWGASGSVSYAMINVNADASEHVAISTDFSNCTSLGLSAKSAFRVNILYPQWFQPVLFSHQRVMDNLRDFDEFFGEHGSLLYYPLALVLVRGFSTSFQNTQQWTYDYERKFSASGGGGFSFCGINFGSKANYGSNVHEHTVDKSNTELKFADDENTIRFVGYVVKKNNQGAGHRFAPFDEHFNLYTDAQFAPRNQRR